MKFRLAELTENFPLLRMVSEGGKWEIGYAPMLFGVRVRIGMVGNGWVDADLCCGASMELRAKVLCYALCVLFKADETSLTHKMVHDLFPYPSRKPLDLDPIWVERLKMLETINAETLNRLMIESYA